MKHIHAQNVSNRNYCRRIYTQHLFSRLQQLNSSSLYHKLCSASKPIEFILPLCTDKRYLWFCPKRAQRWHGGGLIPFPYLPSDIPPYTSSNDGTWVIKTSHSWMRSSSCIKLTPDAVLWGFSSVLNNSTSLYSPSPWEQLSSEMF